jgi:hypothetical protein
VWVEAEVAHVENQDKEGKDERSIQDARKEDTHDQEDAGAYGKNDDRGIKAQLAHRLLGRDHKSITLFGQHVATILFAAECHFWSLRFHCLIFPRSYKKKI